MRSAPVTLAEVRCLLRAALDHRPRGPEIVGGGALPARVAGLIRRRGVRFRRGPRNKKYTALWTEGGRARRVHFGHTDYMHFRDRVPRSRGGGLWSDRDHGDRARRRRFRRRFRATLRRSLPLTPMWFSWHLLW